MFFMQIPTLLKRCINFWKLTPWHPPAGLSILGVPGDDNSSIKVSYVLSFKHCFSDGYRYIIRNMFVYIYFINSPEMHITERQFGKFVFKALNLCQC